MKEEKQPQDEKQKTVISMAAVLGIGKDQLTELRQGEFNVRKLGMPVPYTEVEPGEYKKAKKQCFKLSKRGELEDFDDEKLKVLLILTAVGKDKRSDFRFDDKRLQEHLGVNTAQEAVEKICSIGEIQAWVLDIQDISGITLTTEEEEQQSEDIKN